MERITGSTSRSVRRESTPRLPSTRTYRALEDGSVWRRPLVEELPDPVEPGRRSVLRSNRGTVGVTDLDGDHDAGRLHGGGGPDHLEPGTSDLLGDRPFGLADLWVEGIVDEVRSGEGNDRDVRPPFVHSGDRRFAGKRPRSAHLEPGLGRVVEGTRRRRGSGGPGSVGTVRSRRSGAGRPDRRG